MAVKLPSGWLDELRSRVSIEDVVGQSVQLRKKGKYLWACCPFHNEKTASFKVDTESQMYYCFGCHKGGNAISFLMDHDHLEFMEAVEALADMAHMPMPDRIENAPEDDHNKQLREQIYEANLFAARFFHAEIWKSSGAEALNYLYKRGLNDSDIKRFGLGAAPNSGGALYQALEKAGFSDEVIEKAWLGGKKEQRKYDMFRDRVIFPILSPQGKVLGFGGRIMGDGNPKYLNTSDTPVFNKRNGLYALNFAKKERGLKRLVLVEGYMDTVSLLKYGVVGVVATLGTALTEEQARLMKRYVNEVWVSYDGDGAGQKAALRALDIFETQGLKARVIAYPSGMDPDEFIRAKGLEEWNSLKKLEPTEYRLLRAKDGLDISLQEQRTQYAMKACEILKRVDSPIELENYLTRLSKETGYSKEVLMRQIGVSAQTENAKQPYVKPEIKIYTDKKSELQRAQMQLIALINQGKIPAKMVEREDFDSSLYADIYDYLAGGALARDFIGDIPEEQQREALEALNFEPLPEEREKALDFAEELLHRIHQLRINQRIIQLTGSLKTANEGERANIQKQLQILLSKLD